MRNAQKLFDTLDKVVSKFSKRHGIEYLLVVVSHAKDGVDVAHSGTASNKSLFYMAHHCHNSDETRTAFELAATGALPLQQLDKKEG